MNIKRVKFEKTLLLKYVNYQLFYIVFSFFQNTMVTVAPLFTYLQGPPRGKDYLSVE